MESINNFQTLLIQNKHLFKNSFYKTSFRQFNIFETLNDKKEYANYLISYTLHHCHLSFVKKIFYTNTKNINYNVNNGELLIPKQHLNGDFIILLPFINTLVEYKNLFNLSKNKDIELFKSLLNKNIQKIFKANINFEIKKPPYEIARVDFIQKNLFDFVHKTKMIQTKSIKSILLPNIEKSWLFENFNYHFLLILFDKKYILFEQKKYL